MNIKTTYENYNNKIVNTKISLINISRYSGNSGNSYKKMYKDVVLSLHIIFYTLIAIG